MGESEVKVFNAIKRALKPHGNVNLIDWAKKNCPVTNSLKGSHINFDLTPYFKEPYVEIMSNPTLKEVYISAPTGSGKSTLLTAIGTTVVALYPKQLMYVMQSEQMTVDFLDLHLKPAMKKNPTIARLWPKRNMDRKESIHFPHCNIYTGYFTAVNTLQSRSIDLLLIDELHLAEREGIISDCRARLHQRPGSRLVGVSQGGIIGDQFHKVFNLGQIKKFAWKCEGCGERIIYKFEDLIFNYEKQDDGTPIWKSIYVQLKCPHCEKMYEDNIETRRRLSENALYVVDNPEQNFLPNQVSYQFNQMSVYDVSWTQTVRDFLNANTSTMRSTELKKFQQQKLGEFYDEAKNTNTINLESLVGGYKMDDYKFEQWDLRIMTVDVQQSQMYIVIRDWTKQGASRLVAFKYCSTFSDIEKIRIEYNVKSKAVFCDAAYRPAEVKMAGAQFGWLGLNGREDRLYKVKNKAGKTVERPYSDPVNYSIKTNTGNKTFQVLNYSGLTIKDTLNTIMNSPENTWNIPDDGVNYSMYIHQLKSEVREISKISGKPYYRKIGDGANHAWDGEVMQIVGAMIWQLIVCVEEEVVEP